MAIAGVSAILLRDSGIMDKDGRCWFGTRKAMSACSGTGHAHDDSMEMGAECDL